MNSSQLLEKKSPVGIVKMLLALANYLGGYCWLYPLIFQWITYRFWGHADGIFEWMGWVIYLFTLALTIWLCWDYYAESWERFKHYGSEMLVELATHEFLIFACMIAMGLVVSAITGGAQSENQQAIEEILGEYPVLMITASCLIAPIIEESIFRGIFYRSVRSKYSILVASLVSSFLFGFLHVYDAVFAGNFMELAYILVYGSMGYAFCHLYERTGTIHACIILHMIHNTLTMWLMTLI